MSMSILGLAAPAASAPQIQNSTPAPVRQQSSPPPQSDTVTLSAAAQKASQAGDVDHDGDSH